MTAEGLAFLAAQPADGGWLHTVRVHGARLLVRAGGLSWRFCPRAGGEHGDGDDMWSVKQCMSCCCRWRDERHRESPEPSIRNPTEPYIVRTCSPRSVSSGRLSMLRGSTPVSASAPSSWSV